MRLRFKKQWNRHMIGSEADIPGGVGSVLVRRGVAEAVDPVEALPVITTPEAAPRRKRVKAAPRNKRVENSEEAKRGT